MVDAAIAPVWVATNLFLVWAGWRASRGLMPEAGVTLRACQIVLFWWAAVVLAAVTLGAVGLLSGPALLASGILCGATLVFAAQRIGRLEIASAAADDSQKAAPGGWWFGERLWLALWGIWLAWMVARVASVALLSFPNDWDTLMYHLPLVDQWLRAGSLYAPADPVWYNAANLELAGLWCVGPFSGDFFAGLTNLPALVLVVAAAIELGGEFGLTRRVSHVVALAVVSNWVVFRQSLDSKNDMAVAALFLATLLFGMRYLRTGQRGALVYAACAFGLLCGVKYYAVGYAGVALLSLAAAGLINRRALQAGSLAGASALGAGIWAGYWYARNFWITGTPIYPKGLGGRTDVLLQIRPQLWESTLLGNGSPEVLPLLTEAVEAMTGPCHVAALLVLPALLAWLIGSGIWIWVHGQAADGSRRLLLAALITGCGLSFGLTPFVVETVPGTMNMLRGRYLPVRFGLCFLTLSVFALGVLLQDISRGLRGVELARRWPAALSLLPLVGLGLAAAWQFYDNASRARNGQLLDTALLAWNMLLLMLIVVTLRNLPRRTVAACAGVGGAVLAVALSWGVHELSRSWHDGYAGHYDTMFHTRVFRTLQKSEPAGTRLCVFGDRYYPFFGSRRQFAPCRPPYLASREQALAYVQRQRVSLVTAHRDARPRAERFDGWGGWLRDFPEVFVPLDTAGRGGGVFQLWRVDHAMLERVLAGSAEVPGPGGGPRSADQLEVSAGRGRP